MPPRGPKKPDGPPPVDLENLPDFDFEARMVSLISTTDPIQIFALRYVQTQNPLIAYFEAFGEDDETKARILGGAMLNSPEVQVAIAEIYHKIGARLNITKEALTAIVYQRLISPTTETKEIAKLTQLLGEMSGVIKVKGDTGDGDKGRQAPQVHVHITAAQAPEVLKNVTPVVEGDASVPSAPMLNITMPSTKELEG